MAEESQNADSGKRKKNNKNKEKTIQQQKGLPTLSADLKNNISSKQNMYILIFFRRLINIIYLHVL